MDLVDDGPLAQSHGMDPWHQRRTVRRLGVRGQSEQYVNVAALAVGARMSHEGWLRSQAS